MKTIICLLVLIISLPSFAGGGNCTISGAAKRRDKEGGIPIQVRRAADAENAADCEKQIKEMCRDLREDWKDPGGLRGQYNGPGDEKAWTIKSSCGLEAAK